MSAFTRFVLYCGRCLLYQNPAFGHILENMYMTYIISEWWEHLPNNYKNEFAAKECDPNHVIAISFQTLFDFFAKWNCQMMLKSFMIEKNNYILSLRPECTSCLWCGIRTY